MRPRKEGERRRNLFQLNMEDGSTSSELAEKPSMQHGRPQKPGPWPPKIDPFVPRTDHNPRELKSWAKRTGFNPKFSGETATTLSEVDLSEETEPPSPTPPPNPNADLQRGLGFSKQRTSLLPSSSAPPVKTEIEPILGNRRTRCENVGVEIKAVPTNVDKRNEVRDESEDLLGRIRRTDNNSVAAELELSPKNDVLNRKGGFSNGIPKVTPVVSPEEANKNWEDKDRGDVEIGMLSGSEDPDYPFPSRPSGLNCDLTENPGFPKLIYFGLQHYLSLAGSLVFIPSIIVPTMGGSDEDTATVISTMLLISGITTILHSYFGTRLPLVQGSSFVYLAPALVIINSEQFRNLSENKFKHIMRELQGAIIVGSLFQTVLGYSGLMSLILRLINPMVVAPTVAAVGLAYFSYGFPQTGTCAAISIPQIVLVLIFTLYLRRISVFGHRVFLIYAVPLSIAIMWAIAFFTTAGGAYDYKDCNPNIPTSNILLDGCRKHVISMKQCRTDVSNAWRTAAWVRIPYPLQWGSPTFHFRTSFIMAIVSLVASVDSVGSYHATSLLINIKPPTPGIVSRGIGLEGCTSILAGLWGTGTGSTTLTENVHTIDVTKMAGRRAIETGAAFLILFSFVGKIGAILASIPLALSASVLCFTWALIVALGLSTLQYTQTASSRNVIIVGFSLFLSLSLPAYVQQYQPISSLVLPSYLLPYSAASNGPVHTGNPSLDYALNALLSLNMVVALFVAFILDNTVPGGRQERGAYIWSSSSRGSDGTHHDPSLSGYYLPETISRFFSWVKWVGS